MNIYVITHNNFLYSGIYQSINKTNNITLTQLDPEVDNLDTIENASQEDVFVIDMQSIDFILYLVNSVARSLASGVIIKHSAGWSLNAAYNFPCLSNIFNLDDFLNALHAAKVTKNKKIDKKDKVTPSERTILIYSLRGLSIWQISKKLNISEKTTYCHQKSALNKIGLRRLCDVGTLPADYIGLFHARKSKAL